ncbi:Reverse transcriptase (RNA-dependent DNA polymerase) [Phytophthora infestans]|uniref:Reverse transcriptase (RNA-dependent DNA polymerase) n=1 Tax=Phytophthora infestans TaxID=4787 RepID=A0A833WBN1_PHYIN|nr:Reverse transcriptase (RNA-dependent DNA polymerase) [Phytophthora infestans]KAF4148066.1 Reverse transcriptase (RNA-dependent DNA polymerase) [Phytophthora infestans]
MALYGLCQTGAACRDEIDVFVKPIGLLPTTADKYVCCIHCDGLLIVLLYVDDILIVYEHGSDMKRMLSLVAECYDAKNLGIPKV